MSLTFYKVSSKLFKQIGFQLCIWSAVNVQAQTNFVWLGEISSEWDNQFNWSPTGIPGNNAIIHINNDGVNFPCEITSDRTISTLNLSVGILNLNGFTLIATTANITGGVLQNGTLHCNNVSQLANSNLIGVTIRKSGGSNNDWSGNNSFTDFTFINQSNRRVRMAVNQADSFQGNTIINKSSSGQISVACRGQNIFNGNLVINNGQSGTFSFGELGGSVVINNGALLSNGFNSGNLILNNLTQNHALANGELNPTTISFNNVTLKGDIQVVATTINVNESVLEGNNTFTASNINLNGANTIGSENTQSAFTKVGNSNNTWPGGNTFFNFTYNNNHTGTTNFANQFGDDFYGTTTINSNGPGTISLARSNTTRFYGNLVVNGYSSGTLNISTSNSLVIIQEGYALLSNSYSGGTININRLIQLGTASNGMLTPATLNLNGSEFGGSFSANVTGTITMNNCIHKNSNQLTAGNFQLSNNQLSIEQGQTTLTKNANSINDLVGGNTFGNLTLNNNSTARITLGNTNGDNYLGDAIFNKNNTGDISIARSGENVFNGNIVLNCNSAGSMMIGTNSNASVILHGALLTDGFSVGNLIINRLTQLGSDNHMPFTPANFSSLLTHLNGDFAISTTGTITLNQVSFQGNNELEGGRIILQLANLFSVNSGRTILTKNASISDVWTGGNHFGELTVNNNSSSLIRMASVNGDIFERELIINKNNTGDISIAASGENLFHSTVKVNSVTSGTIRFGEQGGTSLFTQNATLQTDNFTQGNLVLNQIIQQSTQANGHFQPENFTAVGTILQGEISVHASGSINSNNSSFIRHTNFTAPNITLSGSGEFATADGAQFSVIKTGSSNNYWNGGNTFGKLVIHQNSSGLLRLASNQGDTFLGEVIIHKIGTGEVRLAHIGENIFHSDITLNASATGAIRIGESNGTVELADGAAIKTQGFSQASLFIHNFNQSGHAHHQHLHPLNFTCVNSIFNGDIQITASGSVTLTNTSMRGNATISAANITLNGSGHFAQLPNTSVNFTKTGGTNNTWQGGNTFGNITVTNLSNAQLRMGGNMGDTYNGHANFIRSANGQLQVAHQGTNIFRGNISTQGTNQSVTFAGGNSGVIAIAGTSDQTLSGNANQSISFSRLTLNSQSKLILQAPLNITGNLTFNAGYIRSTSQHLLTLMNNATCNGASNASHVIGPVRKVGNQSFVFPVGNGEIYKPIGISAPSNNTHHFTAEFFYENSDISYPHSHKASSLNDISTCGYWILDRTHGNSAVSVTLNHGRAACSVYDIASLKVARWNGSMWVDHGQGSANTMDVVSNGPITSFSPFAVSYEFQEPLPVQMVNYSAKAEHEVVKVAWATASEINSSYFSIERSLDLENYENIATIQAAYYSNNLIEYEFIDRNPFAGISYYRIVQVDMDGKKEIFGPMMVVVSTDFAEWNVFPNPCSQTLTIDLSHNKQVEAVELVDFKGHVVKRIDNTQITAFQAQLNLQSLAQGVYFVRLINHQGIQYKRIVKQ